MLVELGKMDILVQARFEKAITDVLGDEASVRTVIPQLTVEIKNITSTSAKKEVEEAIKNTRAENIQKIWRYGSLQQHCGALV